MDDLELRNLAARAAAGGDRELEDLLAASHGHLMSFLHLLGVPESDIEDVAQEVGLKMLKGLPRYDADQAFLPWLRTIARNTVANFWRSQSRERSHVQAFREHVLELFAPCERANSLLNARVERLRECMEKLPQQQKSIVHLRYLQGFSAEDVARKVALKANHVRQLLFRARGALVRCVETAEVGSVQ